MGSGQSNKKTSRQGLSTSSTACSKDQCQGQPYSLSALITCKKRVPQIVRCRKNNKDKMQTSQFANWQTDKKQYPFPSIEFRPQLGGACGQLCHKVNHAIASIRRMKKSCNTQGSKVVLFCVFPSKLTFGIHFQGSSGESKCVFQLQKQP